MKLQSVIERLHALRRRLLRRILALGISRLVLVGVGLIFLTLLLDWALDLPRAVRAVLLVGGLALLAWQAVLHLIRPLRRKPDIDELALMAERADPQLNDQVISAIQLERDLENGTAVESPELIKATISDTAQRFGKHTFRNAVNLKPTVKPMLLAGAALLATGALAASFPDVASLWFRRQVLLSNDQWPREHDLIITIVDMEKFDPVTSDDGSEITLHVSERTPLQIQVHNAKGALPPEVELMTTFEGQENELQQIAMGRSQGSEIFQHIFPPLVRSLSFYAEGGDDDDERPIYHVKVARAPRVTRFWADYDPPSYTGMEKRNLPDANITAPEGTRITMHFEVNMPTSVFELAFENRGAEVLTPGENGQFTHSFVLDSNDFYSYRIKGANGVNSPDVPRYVITCSTDLPPRVAIDMPRSSNLILTPNALVPLRGVASDDYGITAIELRLGEDGQNLTLPAQKFEGDSLLQPLGSRQVSFFHPLAIDQIVLPAREANADNPPRPERNVAEGDRLAFRFLVADNRRTSAQPDPHRTFGDYEYNAIILSPEDLQRELAQRQARLRGRVDDLHQLVEARLLEMDDLLKSLRSNGPQGAEGQARFWKLDQDQNRISVELKASARQFIVAYDGYLWNRVEEGALTDNMISELGAAWRKGTTEDVFKIYGEAVDAVRPLVDELEVMGRLTAILDLFISTAAELSPEVQRQVSRAALVNNHEDRLDRLAEAQDLERRLRDDLVTLKAKLEAWEDYLDVVQKLRSLLDQQQGIREKIEDLTNKK